MSKILTDSQRRTMSYSIENWMITELDLGGVDLHVFAIVYAYEPISIEAICDLFGRRDLALRRSAQRLIERYLLVVQADRATLEIAPHIHRDSKFMSKRVAAKKKVEATSILDGTPSVMCANEVDGRWWYEAIDPMLSLIERKEKSNEGVELKNVPNLKDYHPYERRVILQNFACAPAEIGKQIKEMQKAGVKDCDECVVLLLGKAAPYDPLKNGKKIARQKKKDKLNEKATELFQIIWNEYPRKTAKAQALKTFLSKLKNCEDEYLVTQKSRQIYREMKRAIANWQNERDGEGRPIEFIPYFSSWLNDTIE